MRFSFGFNIRTKRTAFAKDSPENSFLWEASAGTAPGADPETATQWQRLERTLESARENRLDVPLRPRTVPAISFGLAVVCIIAIAVYLYPRVSTVSYETARGQQTHVVLADSTEIILNHSTSLTVTHKLFDDTRYVELSGEAYFNVRKNGSPFIVQTSAATITVLGTAFNVRIRESMLEVGVNRGRVNVSAHTAQVDSAVVLSKGEATICRTGAFPEAPQQISFAGYPGWMHGRLFFYKTEMTQVVREIEESSMYTS